MKGGGLFSLILIMGILISITGCSSLVSDDQDFIRTWDQYIEKRSDYQTRIINALENENGGEAVSLLKEYGRYASETYKKVGEYRVSSKYEQSHYWFAYSLRNTVDCCNQMSSYIKGLNEGSEMYLKNQQKYEDLMKIPCDAAESHLKKAYENLP